MLVLDLCQKKKKKTNLLFKRKVYFSVILTVFFHKQLLQDCQCTWKMFNWTILAKLFHEATISNFSDWVMIYPCLQFSRWNLGWWGIRPTKTRLIAFSRLCLVRFVKFLLFWFCHCCNGTLKILKLMDVGRFIIIVNSFLLLL